MAKPLIKKQSAPKKKASKPLGSAKPQAGGAPQKKSSEPLSHGDLFERYSPLARKVRAEDVQPCRADVRVALSNVRRGLGAVFGEPGSPDRKANIAELREALPKIAMKAVLELEDLARALVVATGKIVTPASTGEIDEKLGVVRALREPMLTTAEVLAGRGILPAEIVAKIRQGTGKYDMASDGEGLARLYRDHAAAIAGKHPFTHEELERIRSASEWLLDRLMPAGAPRPPAAGKKAFGPEDIRDRFWTLVVKRHSDLRLMGYYRFRDELDLYVPKLQSRTLGASAGEPVPEDSDVAAPGAGEPSGG